MERKPSPLSKFFDAVDLLENILCGGQLMRGQLQSLLDYPLRDDLVAE